MTNLEKLKKVLQEKLSVKEVEEYISTEGSLCVKCQSSMIEGQEIEIDGSFALQKIICNDCDYQWQNVYQLAGVTPMPTDRERFPTTIYPDEHTKQ